MSKWLPWLLGDGSAEQQHKHMLVLLGWSKAGAGRAQISACFFSFHVRSSAPCLTPGSWSLLSHSETAVCFPVQYKTKRKLDCALVPGGSQRGEDPKS